MYSQSEEERHILSAVGDAPGILLDIGAWEGKFCSNSLRLIQLGWGGVLVEPSPSAFLQLFTRHLGNDRLALVNALVAPQSGLYKFHHTHDAVSTTEPERYEQWRNITTFDGDYFAPAITIDTLMDTFPQLDRVAMVSIDTEGTSPQLFYTFPFHRVRPKCFVIEYDAAEDKIMALAQDCGYRSVYKSSENLVLVRG